MTPRRCKSLLVPLIAGLSFGLPQQSFAVSQSPGDSSTGTISGTIFDRDSDTPVEGVRLGLRSPDVTWGQRSSLTDSTGTYMFRDLPLGEYVLTIARLGYQPLTLDVLVNRSAPVRVSVGMIPAPISLPEVGVESPAPSSTLVGRGVPSVISRRNTIRADEIAQRGVGHLDGYLVLRRLRPAWLNERSEARIQGSENYVVLYVDNVRRGNVEDLRSIEASMIQQIHFFDAIEATQEWGTGHVNGAINVLLKPPAR